KGHEDVELSSGEQQALSLRIFLHSIDWPIRQTVYDLLPRRTTISRAIDVRFLIVESDTVDGDVSSVNVRMARIDLRDLAPRIDRWRRDVLPILAAIFRDVD